MIQCDYRNDFHYPETGIDFHYFNSSYGDLHCHNYWEVFLITKGELYHYINGHTQSLQCGDLFIIRPNDIHKFSQKGSSFSQHLNCMITTKNLQELLEPIFPGLYLSLLNYPDYLQLHISEKEYPRFEEIIDLLYINSTSLSQSALIRFFLLEAIKMFYCKKLLYQTNPVNLYPKKPEWLADLLSKMHSAHYISRPIDALCKSINFSQVHINRLFKSYMGTTIGNYFNQVKLQYACSLLKNTNFTTLEICSRIGFSSLSHFNRIFKKNFQCTPTKFRKTYNNIIPKETLG